MKTTLELPDALLIEAKAAAARQRITLRKLFTRALEKELAPSDESLSSENFIVDEHGWPVYKKKGYSGPGATNELVDRLREEEGV